LPLASPVLLIPNTINGLGACQRHNACGKIHSVTVGALYYVLRCGCTASTFAALCKVRLSQTDMSAVRHPALVNTKTSKSKARGAPNNDVIHTAPLTIRQMLRSLLSEDAADPYHGKRIMRRIDPNGIWLGGLTLSNHSFLRLTCTTYVQDEGQTSR